MNDGRTKSFRELAGDYKKLPLKQRLLVVLAILLFPLFVAGFAIYNARRIPWRKVWAATIAPLILAGRFLTLPAFVLGNPVLYIGAGAVVGHGLGFSLLGLLAVCAIAGATLGGAVVAWKTLLIHRDVGRHAATYEGMRYRYVAPDRLMETLGLPPLATQLNDATAGADKRIKELAEIAGYDMQRPILLFEPTAVRPAVRPNAVKAFSSLKESYVFFTESTDEMRGLQRFVALHEMHHALMSGAIYGPAIELPSWYFIVLYAPLFVIAPDRWPLLAAVVAGVAVVRLKANRTERNDRVIASEIKADYHAVYNADRDWFTGQPAKRIVRALALLFGSADGSHGPPDSDTPSTPWSRVRRWFARSINRDSHSLESGNAHRRDCLTKMIEQKQAGLDPTEPEQLYIARGERMTAIPVRLVEWCAMVGLLVYGYAAASPSALTWCVAAGLMVAGALVLFVVDKTREEVRRQLARRLAVPVDVVGDERVAPAAGGAGVPSEVYVVSVPDEEGTFLDGGVATLLYDDESREVTIRHDQPLPYYAVQHLHYHTADGRVTVELRSGEDADLGIEVPAAHATRWSNARSVRLSCDGAGAEAADEVFDLYID